MSAHIGLAVMVASDIDDLALASGKPPINFKVTESAESALTKARCPVSVKWKPPKHPNLARETLGKVPALRSGWQFH